jgi:hypothetical protein
VAAVYPCNPGGGPIESRFYDVIFDKRPRLVPRPGVDITGETAEPVVDFPLKISKSEPEHFTFRIVPGPACMCSWRLALDWTSGGRSGRTIIDRGYSSIRSYVSDKEIPYHERATDSGEWYPPLPK